MNDLQLLIQSYCKNQGRRRVNYFLNFKTLLQMSANKKYHPWNAKAQTWDYIEHRYIRDWQGKHERMLELVRHIKNSDMKNRLFGSTSMDKLVVSIYDPIDYRKEALHINFDLVSRKWYFKYVALPFQPPEFERTYEENLGIEKFDRFISAIRW